MKTKKTKRKKAMNSEINKKKKKSHSMTIYVSKIKKKKNVLKNINYICVIKVF